MSTARPDLTQLELTLPPYKAGRDRKACFEADGSIVYDRTETGEFDDDPRDINGYQRDPNEPFRFTPLWPQCALRKGVAVRFGRCGCIEVILRCVNGKSPKCADRVKWEECRDCPVRLDAQAEGWWPGGPPQW